MPQGNAAEGDEERWDIEFAKLDAECLIFDQERITAACAMSRQHELFVAQLNERGFPRLG